jgi:mRNA-degrading endonuclease RelE of RelBE toxin-antitoxin system
MPLSILSFFIYLLSSFILFVGEEHQQRQGYPMEVLVIILLAISYFFSTPLAQASRSCFPSYNITQFSNLYLKSAKILSHLLVKITPNKFLLQNLKIGKIGKLEGTSGNLRGPSGMLEPDKCGDACARGGEKFPSLKKEFAGLIDDIVKDPVTGTPIGNNCYNVRLAISSKGKGKSGGARVITYLYIQTETVYLLTLYDKSEKADLKTNELKEMIQGLELG